MGWSLKFNVSTAHVKDAYLAKNIADENAEAPVFEKVGTVYHQSDGPFYLVVETAGVVDAVTLKAKWTAVETNAGNGIFLGEAEYSNSNSATFWFDYSLPRKWPLGTYKVELFLREKLDRTIDFEVVIDN
jgi:hypothetical protein